MNQIKLLLSLLFLLILNITTVKSQTKTDTVIQLQFPNEAVIAADNMNVLYIGMENPISVSVPGEKLEDITISCSDGADVRMVSFGHYIAVAYPKAKDVYITTMAKGKVRGYTHYRIKTKPVPIPLFGNIAAGMAELKDILTQDSIYAIQSIDCPLDTMKYIVKRYTLVYEPTTKEPMIFTVTGGLITQLIKDKLKDAQAGDEIVVMDVDVTKSGSDGLINIPTAIIIRILNKK